jgi:hypothetical protein
MRRSSVTLALIVWLPLVSAACGTGGSPQPSSETPPAASASGESRDACALITAEEAGKILGSVAKPASRSMAPGRSICDYVTEAYESFTLEAVWVNAEAEMRSARSAGKLAAAQAGGNEDPAVNAVMGAQRVENLGDEAYFSRRTTSYVRKGDVLLIFQNAGLNEPAREHWEALVRAALARL